MKYIVYIASLFVFYVHIYGQEFTSARATAIGAYVAVSNDVYGMDWNLAATTFPKPNLEIAFSDNLDFQGFENFRFLSRPWNRHVLAFRKSPSFLVTHIIIKNPRNLPPETPLDLFAALWYEEDYAVGYALRLDSNNAIGFDLKRHKYENTFSSSRFWSLSISLSFQINRKVSLGLIARNIYNYHYQKPINRIGFYKDNTLHVIEVDFESFRSVYSSPAFRLDLGATFRPWSRLLLAMDIFSDGGYGAGFEWEAIRHFFLRMGVNHKSDRLFKPEKVFALSWGLGLAYGPARFDFAYYFPFGSRESSEESTTFGNYSIFTLNKQILILSALFSID